MKNNLTPLLVVAAAIGRGDGTWLMQRRPERVEHGGLWEFPGGKVEPGETPEIALIREIEEELGVTLDPASLAPLGFASGWSDGAGRAIVILLYEALSWTGEPEGREGAQVRWLDLPDIGALDMPPLDTPLWEALVRSRTGTVRNTLAKPG